MRKLFLWVLLSASGPAMAQQDLTAGFDTLVASMYGGSKPGAVVLVAREGRIIYQKAIGMADLELDVPMRPDMVFYIGSMTKQFTAVCILQLLEQGKLVLSDPISKFIPGYPPAYPPITIEHLLTHTSGIVDPPGSNALSDQGKTDEEPEALIHDIMGRPLSFTPGTKMVYSNSGYMILGYIISKVSGISYPDYLATHIFTPLGLTHTYYGFRGKIIPQRVPAYINNRSGLINFAADATAFSAGTILSNTTDLWTWNEALQSGKLLRRETLEKAFTSYKLSDGSETGYGYGWQVEDIQGSPSLEHSGLMGGYTSDALYLRKQDLFVVVLSNIRGPSSEMLAGNLAAFAIGKPYQTEVIALDSTLLKSYVGAYADEAGVQRQVTLENNELYYQRTGGPRFSMKPYEKDKFFFPNTTTVGEVKRDADQRITGLVISDRRRMAVAVNTLKRL